MNQVLSTFLPAGPKGRERSRRRFEALTAQLHAAAGSGRRRRALLAAAALRGQHARGAPAPGRGPGLGAQPATALEDAPALGLLQPQRVQVRADLVGRERRESRDRAARRVFRGRGRLLLRLEQAVFVDEAQRVQERCRASAAAPPGAARRAARPRRTRPDPAPWPGCGPGPRGRARAPPGGAVGGPSPSHRRAVPATSTGGSRQKCVAAERRSSGVRDFQRRRAVG